MSVRGLKTKIAITMAVLLLLGMLSIDLVTMMTAKRDLVRAEISMANHFLARAAELIRDNPGWDNFDGPASARAKIHALAAESDIAGLLVLDPEGRRMLFGFNRGVSMEDLHRLTRETMRTEKQTARFLGSTWGVFWYEKSHLVVSAPLYAADRLAAGLAVAWPLEGVYTALRRSQKFLFLYIFLNAAILTFLGIFRVFKLYLQPLARLAKRAEEYREDHEIIFAVRKEDNELNRLSNALNSMLRRMSADKERLRLTVASLEQANAELKRAQQEIIRAEKLASVGRLSAGIAHEIGNPVGIVMGYLDLIKQANTTGEQAEYIRRTEKEVSRIHQIIRQLLEISRTSQSGSENVSVHELLADVVEVFKVQPLTASIRFECEFQADHDTVLSDPNQLRQVFLNLIINAADAIASGSAAGGGTISVTTASEPASGGPEPAVPGAITIRFTDNGPGIADGNLGNIFDPFFTTKEPGKGTGLGLSVSFMIIERYGGKLTVESGVGKGTTFKIRLPLCPEQPAADPPAENLRVSAGPAGMTERYTICHHCVPHKKGKA